MNYEVLKNLKYSHNGIDVVEFGTGDTLKTKDNVEGLVNEGFLKKSVPKKKAQEIEPEIEKETKEISDIEVSRSVPLRSRRDK